MSALPSMALRAVCECSASAWVTNLVLGFLALMVAGRARAPAVGFWDLVAPPHGPRASAPCWGCQWRDKGGPGGGSTRWGPGSPQAAGQHGMWSLVDTDQKLGGG